MNCGKDYKSTFKIVTFKNYQVQIKKKKIHHLPWPLHVPHCIKTSTLLCLFKLLKHILHEEFCLLFSLCASSASTSSIVDWDPSVFCVSSLEDELSRGVTKILENENCKIYYYYFIIKATNTSSRQRTSRCPSHSAILPTGCQ